MKGNTTFLSRRILYGVIFVTPALLAVGSFVDFPLSYALYDASSPFATFFAAYGAIPAPLGCVAAGTLFVGILLVCFLPALYMPVSPLLLAGVGLVLSAGTILVTCRLAKGADRAMIIRVALAIILVLLCELVVVNLIKVAWGRPRMRLVVNHPEAYFSPGGNGVRC